MSSGGANDPLLRAARVLTRTALFLRTDERFVVVEDAASRAIGDALARAAAEAGVWVKRFDLDAVRDEPQRAAFVDRSRSTIRPLRLLPEGLKASLAYASASAFVANAQHAETAMRQAVLHAVAEHGIRHAHMPGVSEQSFVAGLQIDYAALARVGNEALTVLETAKQITCESEAGTNLTIDLGEEGRWFAQLGVLAPGKWGNVPAGALYASPQDVTGVLVADASLGEFFGVREGLLTQKPVRFEVDSGRVRAVSCPACPELQRDLEAMLAFSANSSRVGLVAIGVNYGVERPTGEAMVDQNLPGLHIGVGDPAGKSTGAAWSAPTCFAACQAKSRVAVDGEVIASGGSLAGKLARFASSIPQVRLSMRPRL
jgi:leucyl aminopeptidase (aminopeptidase T)